MPTPKASAIDASPKTPGRLKTILVATDFSENASSAVEWGTDLASAHSAELVLLHAVETELPALASVDKLLGAHIQNQLLVAEAVAKKGGIGVRIERHNGRAWKVIAESASRINADLIVLGAHGASRLSERFLGGTADRVVRTSPVPVLAVHRGQPRPSRKRLTILVATDFSAEAAFACEMAALLVSRLPGGGRLILFHSVGLVLDYGNFDAATYLATHWEQAERTAAGELEALAARLRSPQTEVGVRTARGLPAEMIMHAAQELGADLIAMGTQGRSGVDRFLLGSVAERVLHRSPCSVLAARRQAD